MHPSAYQTRSRFTVEGLESRILLSAVPADVVCDVEEEPKFYEFQYVAESEVQSFSAEDVQDQESIFEGASVLPLEAAEAPQATLVLTSRGVESESGQLLKAIDPSKELVAQEIRVDDDAVLESVRIRAKLVVFGDNVTWSGQNRVSAEKLVIEGTQSAKSGATLHVTPDLDSASIFLGSPVAGVDFGLEVSELSNLSSAGFELLTVGSKFGTHEFHIDGLEYDGNLTLLSPFGEGTFNVNSAVMHSGGTLTYVGTGNTQNTSADTLTNGSPIAISDSVELVFTSSNGNEIRIDTTNRGAVATGANISITGDIRGTGEDGEEF